MGKQTGLAIPGSHVGIIYYIWKVIASMRRAPVKRKQLRASIATATIFGKAGDLNMLVLDSLEPMLPATGKLWLMRRMDTLLKIYLEERTNGIVLHSGELLRFRHFTLTDQSDFQKLFSVPLRLEWKPGQKLLIQFPAFIPSHAIKAPDGTKAVRLSFMLLNCGIEIMSLSEPQATELTIPYNDLDIGPQEIRMGWPAVPGQLLLLAMSMRYVLPNNINKELKWMPAMIVGGYGA